MLDRGMELAFFDSFKLLNKKSGFVVSYKGDTLITVKPNILKSVLLDNLSKKVLTEIASKITPSANNKKTNTNAMKLLAVYNNERRIFHHNKRIKDLSIKDKGFAYFIKASELMDIHKVTAKTFIQAQINGLGFINEGNGIFPKVSQLATLAAEERLLKFIQTETTVNNPTKVNRIELNRSDKETELMKNPRFVSRYDKVLEDVGTLQDAYFVHDCMLHRKGRVTKKIENYIEELLDEQN